MHVTTTPVTPESSFMGLRSQSPTLSHLRSAVWHRGLDVSSPAFPVNGLSQYVAVRGCICSASCVWHGGHGPWFFSAAGEHCVPDMWAGSWRRVQVTVREGRICLLEPGAPACLRGQEGEAVGRGPGSPPPLSPRHTQCLSALHCGLPILFPLRNKCSCP